MKQFFIIKLVVWLGWLSHIVSAQLELSGVITGSVSFPHVAITCIGNFAAFIISLLRRRFDLEMGAGDFMASLSYPGKWKEIKEKDELIGFTCPDDRYEEASVVMLTSTTGMSNSSIRKFMKYIYHAHNVKSILLKCDLLKDEPVLKQSISQCNCTSTSGTACHHYCGCIVFPKVRGMTFTLKLDSQMPQALKELSNYYLLPSLQCQKNRCHECNHNQLEKQKSTEVDFNMEFRGAVCNALEFDFATLTQKEPICICIPVKDDWTKLLVRFFKSRDQEERGAIVMASDALQSYLQDKKEEDRVEVFINRPSYLQDTKEEDRVEVFIYRPVSLIVPRSLEIVIIVLLTVLFKVDGFSSSLVARRAVRSYVVDSKGNGLPANVFLTRALVVVKSNSVCQVLKFRDNILGSRTLLCVVGFFNLACSMAWAVFIALGPSGKWYDIPSMAPSKPRVAVIIAAIGIVIIRFDCFEYFKSYKYSENSAKNVKKNIRKKKNTILVVIVIEMVIAVVAGAFGLNKGIGRWIYAALQVLVWVKWGVGSYLLGVYSPESFTIRAVQKQPNDCSGITLEHFPGKWDYGGTLVYSSAFLLNAVFAGVRANWAGVWGSW